MKSGGENMKKSRPKSGANYIARINTFISNMMHKSCFGTVCLFVCLFVWIKPEKSILRSLCLEGSNHPWEWLHTFATNKFFFAQTQKFLNRRDLQPRNFIALSLGISSHSEDHRENATRSGKQSEIGRSARPKG